MSSVISFVLGGVVGVLALMTAPTWSGEVRTVALSKLGCTPVSYGAAAAPIGYGAGNVRGYTNANEVPGGTGNSGVPGGTGNTK